MRPQLSKQEKDAIIRKKGGLKDYNQRQMVDLCSIRTFEGFSKQDQSQIQREMQEITDEMNRKILEMFQRRTEIKIQTLNDNLDINTNKHNNRCSEFQAENDQMNRKIDQLKNEEQRCSERIEQQFVLREKRRLLRTAFRGLHENAREEKSRNYVRQDGPNLIETDGLPLEILEEDEGEAIQLLEEPQPR